MNSDRRPPLRLMQEEALARRLPKNHPQLSKILSSIEKRKAGFRGEQNTDYHLTFLPSPDYIILRDLSLIDQHPFQIDTLILTPKLIMLVETKNPSGKLYFEKESNQLIRTYEQVEEGFSNPLQQAERQSRQLENWMCKRKFPSMPIEHLVVISNSKTIIRTNNKRVFERVVHAEHMVDRILFILEKYHQTHLDGKTLKKLYKVLIKENTPQLVPILEYWNIHPQEIIKGTECPYCTKIPMTRIYSNWYCPSCKESSKFAHIQALLDYFLLFNSTITNKQCRDFLLLHSRRTSELLLKTMNLSKLGHTKGVKYIANMDILSSIKQK
jgi:hypothetical protein